MPQNWKRRKAERMVERERERLVGSVNCGVWSVDWTERARQR